MTAPPSRSPTVLRVAARDGFSLEADLFEPSGPVRAAVLIAPAMAVRRKLYGALARFLADCGLLVLVPDYRGVGGSRPLDANGKPQSLRGFQASLHGWAELDLAACVDTLRARAPGVPLVWFGHSMGAQLLGLLPDAPVDAALFVATQSGHHRHWPGLLGAAMWLNWRLVIPVASHLAGRLPMKALGQGEDVPKGVGLEWASWGRHPGYIQRYARPLGGLGFSTFQGPLRSVSFSDDAYAPPRAAAALVSGYTKTVPELVTIAPADVGAPSIGHFGAFRSSFKDTLWSAWREWILAQP